MNQNEEISNYILQEAKKYTPSYRVISTAKKPEVNKGEEIEVEIYLSGYGVPKRSKLYVNYSGIKLPEDTSASIRMAAETESDGSEISFEIGRDAVSTKELGESKHLVYIPDLPLFYPTDEVFGEKSTGFTIPPSHSELEYSNESKDSQMIAPVTLKIPTKSDHKAGNHQIDLILTFTDNYENVYTAKESVNVKIKSWVEKHNKKLRIIAIIVGIITIVLAILAFSMDIIDFLGWNIDDILNLVFIATENLS